MSSRKRAVPRCSGPDADPVEAIRTPKEARDAAAVAVAAVEELGSSNLSDDRRPLQDPPAPGRRLSFVPSALAAVCDDDAGVSREEPQWAGFSMSELPPPLLFQSRELPGGDDDRTRPPDRRAGSSRVSASSSRCNASDRRRCDGEASSSASPNHRPSRQAGSIAASASSSAEQALSAVDIRPAAVTADVLHMPRAVAGSRRSTFGCRRVSLRQAELPCGVAGSVAAEGDANAASLLPLEAQLKAHARACLQEAIRLLNRSVPSGLDGMQQFIVEACEASDRAIDSTSGDELVSISNADRTATPQTSRSDDHYHRLNLALGRECRQWDSLVQSYRANADRAQSVLSRSTTVPATAAAGRCAPALLAVDSASDSGSTSRAELTAAVERSRVQALLAGQRLTRAIAAARRLDVVAAARATEEAKRLATLAIPDTPRQPLSRVLGGR